MLRTLATVAALAAACMTTPAMAQTPTGQAPAASASDPDSTVVVQGRKEEDAVRAFVAEIGEGPKGVNLARWDCKVCVGAINVTPDYAQKLIDRVSLVALAVGLEPGEPGCTANVLILATTDGDALATRVVKDHRAIFHPPETVDDNLGQKALDEFQSSDAPVRWWHVSRTVLSPVDGPGDARGKLG